MKFYEYMNIYIFSIIAKSYRHYYDHFPLEKTHDNAFFLCLVLLPKPKSPFILVWNFFVSYPKLLDLVKNGFTFRCVLYYLLFV
jgi:hypothetical protein